MADVRYNEGVVDAQPQVQAPQDEQNIQPKIGAGVQQLGAGATKAGDFFGQVAADNAFNQYQEGATKILHGDPKAIGPDGQVGSDLGYLGLKGRAALDARPGVEEKLDALQQQIYGGLQTPMQQSQFETYSRRYRAAAASEIGSHADQQTNNWYSQVATDTAKNALDAISAKPTDSTTVLTSASDLVNAYTKQAEINGAVKGDPVWNAAVQKAKKDAFQAQVKAIGAADPARAMGMLQRNPDLAGQDYPALYSDFRTRANDQVGTGFVTQRVQNYTGQAQVNFQNAPINPTQPIYQQAATDILGGMSPAALARTVAIESGGKDVTNASGHVGYGQFSDATWRAYGNGGNPHDFHDSVLAIQRYAAANAAYLAPRLGRPATDAELYLAHQQGPAGAAGLLMNPNAPAASIVGERAVLANGGQPGMTAGQYAAMWTHKFNGTSPAPGSPVAVPEGPRAQIGGGLTAPETVPAVANTVPAAASTEPSAPTPGLMPTDIKAQIFQDIDAAQQSGELTPEQAQIARTRAAQQVQAYQIANDQTAAAVKAANDQALNEYGTQVLAGAGSADLQAKILGDSRLTYEGKKALTDAMMQHANQSPAAAAASYGPGFYKAMGQVLAPPGDPSKITDVTDIFRRAQVGGDLTLQGATYLAELAGKVTKSVDDAQTTEALHSLMAGQKSRMSFQQDTGPIQIKDPAGEQLFQTRFVPKVLGAYDQWIKAGKDPWQFLTSENFAKLSEGLRSPREMALAQLAAQTTGLDTSQIVAPPPPAGADPEGWKLVATSPPLTNDGKAWPQGNWVGAVTLLQQHPTPDVIKQFNDKFQARGVTAEEVLSVITPQSKATMTEWPKIGLPSAPSQPAPAPAMVPPVSGPTPNRMSGR